jgi:hypothetical protein
VAIGVVVALWILGIMTATPQLSPGGGVEMTPTTTWTPQMAFFVYIIGIPIGGGIGGAIGSALGGFIGGTTIRDRAVLERDRAEREWQELKEEYRRNVDEPSRDLLDALDKLRL